MRRVEADQVWSLTDPDQVPELRASGEDDGTFAFCVRKAPAE